MLVAVRVRPFTEDEVAQFNPHRKLRNEFYEDGNVESENLRSIVDVVDENMITFNPKKNQTSKASCASACRTREQNYMFDHVFDVNSSQGNVYNSIGKPLLDGVMDGYNASIFAYGTTGCGKTHTISGTPDNPGIIFLAMQDLFARIEAAKNRYSITVTVSYLQIYNETIQDLLCPDTSASLELREGLDKGIIVTNLSAQNPQSAEDVSEIVRVGNMNRAVAATTSNAVSSRSHAVLMVRIQQRDRDGGTSEEHRTSLLSIIDLAGSERASSGCRKGARFVEGANINRSLLALGNCINALGRRPGGRLAHVPYRDSKLTRLLKFSLGGNCRTAMIVCVSPSSRNYEETLNTLNYGQRARNIRTKVRRNALNVDQHVAAYCKKISEQQADIAHLREVNRKLVGSTQEALNNTQIRTEIRVLLPWRDTVIPKLGLEPESEKRFKHVINARLKVLQLELSATEKEFPLEPTRPSKETELTVAALVSALAECHIGISLSPKRVRSRPNSGPSPGNEFKRSRRSSMAPHISQLELGSPIKQ